MTRSKLPLVLNFLLLRRLLRSFASVKANFRISVAKAAGSKRSVASNEHSKDQTRILERNFSPSVTTPSPDSFIFRADCFDLNT